ncbi:P-loop ATPase, Sll1717 family [Pseudoclavibacter sp. JSM 162008]|uniref:P-loop ATPase, Sll1717 family n=1 Tax=Pseudoclavibacter sp. JSM 162008 TaxID=3229855 RepID=UPI0035269932
MTYNSFVSTLGFTGDPFAFTDSDREEKLSDYFVPPPYFAGVIGEPKSPEPSLIFAPRGGGKSAQRRMVEEAGLEEINPFLCINYSNFESMAGSTPSVTDHLTQLSRLLTLALLTELDDEPAKILHLDSHDRQVLKASANLLLSTLNVDEFRAAMSAVKTIGDKSGELWRKYGGIVAAVIAGAMQKIGLTSVQIPSNLLGDAQEAASSAQYLFAQLAQMSRKLGWLSVYVVIDRVDETDATSSKPQAAFELIRALVTNLTTLEQPGVAFKFFLWDQLRPIAIEAGIRTDRIAEFRLSWSSIELAEMLSARLSAYSDGSIESFNDLLMDKGRLDAHLLLAHLCYGSPRDMIRMAKQIITEATRASSEIGSISEAAIWKGVHEFSKMRTSELYSRFQSDLFKFADVSFVTNKLASDVFRISDNAMRQKLQQWTGVGVIRKMTEVSDGKNRPKHVYTFTDLRVVLARTPLADVQLVLDNYALKCTNCTKFVIGSDAELVCECNARVPLAGSHSLLQEVLIL